MAKMKRAKLVRVCPVCANDKVEEIMQDFLFFFKKPSGMHRCLSCNHTAAKFPEVHPSNLEVYKDQIRNSIDKHVEAQFNEINPQVE